MAEEIPILCSTCLGENPYVKMTKDVNGAACKLCARPYTLFKWKPGGKDVRVRMTEICSVCAKLKNCCQSCVYDLELSVHISVRDAVNPHGNDVPLDSKNRDLYYAKIDAKLQQQGDDAFKALPSSQALLMITDKGMSSANTTSNNNNNNNNINAAVQSNINSSNPNISVPAPVNKGITTLFIGGIPKTTLDREIKSIFQPYGEISSITRLEKAYCAFVVYEKRDGAEKAMNTIGGRRGNVTIKSRPVTIQWGVPQLVKSAKLAATTTTQ